MRADQSGYDAPCVGLRRPRPLRDGRAAAGPPLEAERQSRETTFGCDPYAHASVSDVTRRQMCTTR